MKKIILNVDDFGLTKGVNNAVLELSKQGLVKSTTALVNSPYFADDIKKTSNYDLDVGIHLTIDLFNAELFHPSLCDENNIFHKAKTHSLNRSLDSDVIYREWKSQIEKFIKIAGFKPTHIDSHHHAHIINTDANIAVKRLGEEYGLVIRQNSNDKYTAYCSGDFYGEDVNPDLLIETIEKLLEVEAEYLEVMMHPAFVDQELESISSYNTARMAEYEAVTSEQFKNYIEHNNIQISKFTD